MKTGHNKNNNYRKKIIKNKNKNSLTQKNKHPTSNLTMAKDMQALGSH